jgi:hypothetical protein
MSLKKVASATKKKHNKNYRSGKPNINGRSGNSSQKCHEKNRQPAYNYKINKLLPLSFLNVLCKLDEMDIG